MDNVAGKNNELSLSSAGNGFSYLIQAKIYVRKLSMYLGIFRLQDHLNVRGNRNKIYKWEINKLVVFSDLQKKSHTLISH